MRDADNNRVINSQILFNSLSCFFFARNIFKSDFCTTVVSWIVLRFELVWCFWSVLGLVSFLVWFSV